MINYTDMRKIKKVWVIVISIAIFLIITNPSPSRYKEFCNCRFTAKRDYNFFLFSIYEGYYNDPSYYLGIAFNFIKLKDVQ